MTASAQSADTSNEILSLLKYSLAGFAVDYTSMNSINVTAATPATIDISRMGNICLIAVRSVSQVDVSIKLDVATPVYTGYGSNLYLRTWNPARTLNHLILLSTVTTDVEVVIAGRITP